VFTWGKKKGAMPVERWKLSEGKGNGEQPHPRVNRTERVKNCRKKKGEIFHLNKEEESKVRSMEANF